MVNERVHRLLCSYLFLLTVISVVYTHILCSVECACVYIQKSIYLYILDPLQVYGIVNGIHTMNAFYWIISSMGFF